jgi:ADP-ribose pyrophosphatase
MTPPAVVARQRMFAGKVFDVDRDRLRFEDGRETEVDIVRHRPSVVMIPVTDDGKIVLVRQYRHAIAQWLWELPAGTTDPGEDPDAAAPRECHEEIGLRPGKITLLADMFPTPGFCDEVMRFYLCEELRKPEYDAAHDIDEQLEPRAFTVDEVQRMIAAGEVTDMKTVTGLALLSSRPRT